MDDGLLAAPITQADLLYFPLVSLTVSKKYLQFPLFNNIRAKRKKSQLKKEKKRQK